MNEQTISGVVKWYDIEKGYGFIARNDGGDDLFVHRSAVGMAGLAEGDEVTCVPGRGPKGPTAEQVRVTVPSGQPPRSRATRATNIAWAPEVDPATLPRLTGTLKRYDAEKGFGFVTPDDGSPDVFVHRSAAGFGVMLSAGDRLEFRLGEGPKGPRAELVRRLNDQQADWSGVGSYRRA